MIFMRYKCSFILKGGYTIEYRGIMKGNIKQNKIGKILKKYFPNIITGIIVAIFVPLISFFLESIDEEKSLYYDLHNIGLGMSEQYMEECFGVPKYIYYDNENDIVENIYYTENEVIRAFFVDLKLEGYFITMLNKNPFGLKLPKIYRKYTNDKKIGDISYYEIIEKPIRIYGNQGVGYSHYAYLEENYFAGNGRYNRFYFGFFDYGYGTKNVDKTDKVKEEYDGVKMEGYEVYYVDRKKSYPNTYGICSPRYFDKIYNLVLDFSKADWDYIQNDFASHQK